MLADRPPLKARHLAEFLESDRLRTIELPPDECLRKLGKSIESAMQVGKSADVRRTCVDFLAATSDFYSVPPCAVRVLAARPLRVREYWATELFGRLQPRNHADPGVDEDGSAEGDHLLRDFPEHALP